MPIRCVLLDIEGTIIPVTFVRDVLFPYAARQMTSFLRDRRDDPEVQRWTTACQETVAYESRARPSYDSLAGILLTWIDADRKHPGLKALQGMIWEAGYRNGDFMPALYGDVVPCLRRLRRAGVQPAIYSSGSVQAQKLLLEHTTEGDLTPLFAEFFDTAVGPKTDPASYRRIADRLGVRPDEMLFLSDAESELDSAKTAGMQSVHVVRPGTSPGPRHRTCATFNDLWKPAMPFAETASPGA
ncbi:MAG: acireductone synthase [Nitrospira sp.]